MTDGDGQERNCCPTQRRELNGKFLIVAGEDDWDIREHFLGDSASFGQAFPIRAAKVHEDDSFDVTSGKIAEHILGLEVRQLADQQIHWFLEHGFQVLRCANVGTVHDPGFASFN